MKGLRSIKRCTAGFLAALLLLTSAPVDSFADEFPSVETQQQIQDTSASENVAVDASSEESSSDDVLADDFSVEDDDSTSWEDVEESEVSSEDSDEADSEDEALDETSKEASDEESEEIAEEVDTEQEDAKEHNLEYVDNQDGTHSAVCTDEGCEYVIESEEHIFVDGVCVCGAVEEPEYDAATLQGSGTYTQDDVEAHVLDTYYVDDNLWNFIIEFKIAPKEGDVATMFPGDYQILDSENNVIFSGTMYGGYSGSTTSNLKWKTATVSGLSGQAGDTFTVKWNLAENYDDKNAGTYFAKGSSTFTLEEKELNEVQYCNYNSDRFSLSDIYVYKTQMEKLFGDINDYYNKKLDAVLKDSEGNIVAIADGKSSSLYSSAKDPRYEGKFHYPGNNISISNFYNYFHYGSFQFVKLAKPGKYDLYLVSDEGKEVFVGREMVQVSNAGQMVVDYASISSGTITGASYEEKDIVYLSLSGYNLDGDKLNISGLTTDDSEGVPVFEVLGVEKSLGYSSNFNVMFKLKRTDYWNNKPSDSYYINIDISSDDDSFIDGRTSKRASYYLDNFSIISSYFNYKLGTKGKMGVKLAAAADPSLKYYFYYFKGSDGGVQCDPETGKIKVYSNSSYEYEEIDATASALNVTLNDKTTLEAELKDASGAIYVPAYREQGLLCVVYKVGDQYYCKNNTNVNQNYYNYGYSANSSSTTMGLYPNSGGRIIQGNKCVIYAYSTTQAGTLYVYDVNSQKTSVEPVAVSKGSGEYVLNTENLAPGSYRIQLEANDGKKVYIDLYVLKENTFYEGGEVYYQSLTENADGTLRITVPSYVPFLEKQAGIEDSASKWYVTLYDRKKDIVFEGNPQYVEDPDGACAHLNIPAPEEIEEYTGFYIKVERIYNGEKQIALYDYSENETYYKHHENNSTNPSSETYGMWRSIDHSTYPGVYLVSDTTNHGYVGVGTNAPNAKVIIYQHNTGKKLKEISVGNSKLEKIYYSEKSYTNLGSYAYGKAFTASDLSGLDSKTVYTIRIVDENGKQISSYDGYVIPAYTGSTTVKTYTITYKLNGGTNSSLNPAKYQEGSPVALSDPTRAGYVFDGWYKDAAFATGRVTSVSGGNVTLYAKWIENGYTIAFNKNAPEGTEVSGSMEDMSLGYTKAANLTANAYTLTGYTFKGWSLTSDGAVKYADKAKVSKLTSENGAVFNLYAVWTKNEYTVTAAKGNYYIGFAASPDVASTGKAFELKANQLEDYSFYVKPKDGYRIDKVTYKIGTVTKEISLGDDEYVQLGDGYYCVIPKEDITGNISVAVTATALANLSKCSVTATFYGSSKANTAPAVSGGYVYGDATQEGRYSVKVMNGKTEVPTTEYTVELTNKNGSQSGPGFLVITASTGSLYCTGQKEQSLTFTGTKITDKKSVYIETGDTKIEYTALDINPYANLALYDIRGFENKTQKTEDWEAHKLTRDTDYKLYFKSSGMNVTVTVVGINSYEGTYDIKYTITPADLSKAVDISAMDDSAREEVINSGALCYFINDTNCIYTGSQVYPQYALWHGGYMLNSSEISRTYKNNIKAGTNTAQFIIKGSGNYKGSITKKYTIKPYDLTANLDEFEITVPNMKYTGKEVKPVPTVKWNYESSVITLKNNTDFKIEPATAGTNKDVGTGTVTISGKGNFTGTLTQNFSITDKGIDNDVTINTKAITNIAFAGKDTYIPDNILKQVLTDKKTKEPLARGTDYYIDYSNNGDGTFTATVTGRGDYSGTKTFKFKVTPKEVNEDTLEILIGGEESPSYSYNGSAWKPYVQIYDTDLASQYYESGAYELTQGKEYTVKYVNNTNASTPEKQATVEITFKGNYSKKTIKKYFRINKLNLNTTAFSPKNMDYHYAVSESDYRMCYYYTGKDIKPALDLLRHVEGTSYFSVIKSNLYKVEYEKNCKAVGEKKTIKITPKNANVEGELTLTYDIIKGNLNDATNTVVSNISAQTYKGKAVTPKVTVKCKGVTLKEGRDYRLEYSDNNARGIGKVKIIPIEGSNYVYGYPDGNGADIEREVTFVIK